MLVKTYIDKDKLKKEIEDIFDLNKELKNEEIKEKILELFKDD
jgi:hypothetical protein